MSADVDKILAKESSLFNTDREIDRIMTSFILDPYSVLDIQPGVPPEEIKKLYRKKSLLIHPDKTKNPRASDAFDRLKKAEAELMDDTKRAQIDSVIAVARDAVIVERGLDKNSEEIKTDEFWRQVREMTKKFLIEDEVRRRKARRLQMEQEGREKQAQEDAANEAKRKREAEKEWEDTRDSRVQNWRNFATTGPSKKKKKIQVLG